ncbi:uncharacterized protein LOC141532786 [Cotesia typhae]|uniref:uncharacterized protein LOC141532786 n=1 Tax=Cotesia typhae TaxID=2053667 RepID=UPI003D69B357
MSSLHLHTSRQASLHETSWSRRSVQSQDTAHRPATWDRQRGYQFNGRVTNGTFEYHHRWDLVHVILDPVHYHVSGFRSRRKTLNSRVRTPSSVQVGGNREYPSGPITKSAT